MAMNYDDLRASIEANIKTNNERAITGQVLQDVLVEMTDAEEAVTDALLRGVEVTPAPYVQESSVADGVATVKLRIGSLMQYAGGLAQVQDVDEFLTNNYKTADEVDEAIGNLPTFEDVNRISYEQAERLIYAGDFATKTIAQGYADAAKTEAVNEAVGISQAYVDDAVSNRATWTEIVTYSDAVSSLEVLPGKFYRLTSAVESLTVITLGDDGSKEGLDAFSWGFEFTTSNTVGTISLPSWWRFPDTPTFEADMTYQVSVVWDCAVVVGWPNS